VFKINVGPILTQK